MGISITQETFTDAEYHAFSERLYQSLDCLKELIQRPAFGQGQHYIGAELENYIVDKNGYVLPLNQAIIEAAQDHRYTVELNRFNLEVNFDPIAFKSSPFSQLQTAIEHHHQNLQQTATNFDAEIVPIGILPTLRQQDLDRSSMTDLARYRSLSKQLFNMRGDLFKINITGADELQLNCDHVAVEGANTSFQYHLMVKHEDFANAFNAVQLITPMVLALAANSPIFLGNILWNETRVALFKQSIDSRQRGQVEWRQPARVTFGHGWVRQNAWELFAEAVALYPPMFPIISDQPINCNGSALPPLEELCLHLGTIWPWNRPVYCPNDGGHVRIEMRALPAGPTAEDMCANVAFATGLVQGLIGHIDELLAVIPFRFAEYNFYRAAQRGLDASIVWTSPSKHEPQEQSITTVIESMLPLANAGLKELGVADQERESYMNNIYKRLESGQTGATWQKEQVRQLNQKLNREESLEEMFRRYRQLHASGVPVSEWTFESI
ncbi:glutamate-cysteine ligase family protein [Pleionea litopenaei]|uniref:Glutamate-cysteine ligase family protein n=1 Tax=Pleionea litopenaei TaxID=3070815 RepID=A0AA51X848_9GAMM|nr:glutamate-cysteine ligase family protein [Pleionea sp. HL-JVS1]WMS88913.1 glutamate-cysteine ligase family protein [Pleionea sp. HL-JVS1]